MTTSKTTSKKVLLLVTSHATLGDSGQKTGFWLEELAAPYYELTAAGFAVDIASPKGGRPPADPKSEKTEAASVRRFLDDRDAMAKLEATKKLDEIGLDYDAYFVVGGHGVVFDLGASDASGKLLGRAWDSGKIVAAVCHGPAALVPVKDAKGASIVAGRRVTGFSNEEEDAVGLTSVVPFPLQSKLEELGGKYERGAKWASFAVRDGRLVTGQNPASSAATAKLVIEALEA
jgi:putative intracellular protease/amidase